MRINYIIMRVNVYIFEKKLWWFCPRFDQWLQPERGSV